MPETKREDWPGRLSKGAEEVHAMWIWTVTNRPDSKLLIEELETLYRLLRQVGDRISGQVRGEEEDARYRAARQLIEGDPATF
jgi:hypothetical protein